MLTKLFRASVNMKNGMVWVMSWIWIEDASALGLSNSL
jgi:hypothetical protein